ncbi:MAG: short-chain dehydrogenase/reductase [Bryobacterales bacterium]|jgi:3-oxoacyl-[acyl-carrier protein] reductase|nr:short-chain dehydrogenase/reductase [Bryobacterales bacterium]
MSGLIRNKKAIVTGGSKGIGFAVAKALLAEGADVVLCGRKQKGLDRALAELKGVSGGKASGFVADVSRSQDAAELFNFADKELGGLDYLINNAGIGVFRAAGELSVEEWDRVIATNLSGAFYCSREAIERFRVRKSGWIVNISSLAGRNPFAGGSAYNASKFGLNGFSEAMMLDHRNDNIRVSYVMPGSVDTGFSGHEPEKKSEWKIAPEDIGEIVLDILKMPTRTLISRIEVRPSRPQKD